MRPVSSDDFEQWRLLARCRTEDPALFFHPEGERGTARARREQLAKRICAQCPVIGACLHHSMTHFEAFGTWGGLSEAERSDLLPSRVANVRTHRSRTHHVTRPSPSD
jgi:WhiB family redox-sensing transcriptional regulator